MVDHKRTVALTTQSIRLLRERITKFDIVEHVERWRRYDIHEELGRGAMGVVWRATDTEVKREVALKCITSDETNNEENVARFFDEIQLHARLTHPAIAPIYDFGLNPDGDLFMSMAVVFGDNLERLIDWYHKPAEAERPTNLTDLLNRFLKICDAIAFAHEVGIIHRDLKPENIMCGEFGEVYVMDWGLATTSEKVETASETLDDTQEEREAARAEVKASIERRAEKSRRRATTKLALAHRSIFGSVVGTIGYMSPEQALGRHDRVDHRSDVYALSSMLYHILCGKPPVEGDKGSNNVWDVLDAVIDGRIVAPTQRGSRHAIPDQLAAISVKGISREPKDRFATARELSHAIEAWMHTQAMSSQIVIDVELAIDDAEAKLEAGRPEDAKLLLAGALEKLVGIDGAERLRDRVREILRAADQELEVRDRREEAIASFKKLHQALVESQFGLVLSHLRLPAPTVRRAHDTLFASLQLSGVWANPSERAKVYREFEAGHPRHAGANISVDRTILTALFLFSWVSIRMANVTAQAHGKEVFRRHAAEAIEHLATMAPEFRSLILMRSRLAAANGDSTKARELEEEAKKIEPKVVDDHIFVATIHYVDYQLRDAFHHIDTALSLDPGAFWGHALLIFVYYGLGKRDSTAATLRTCQALQPTEPILWTIKGYFHREYGQFEEANEAMEVALRYGPNDPLARLIRADLRLRLDRIDWERDLDYAADLVTPPKTTWDYFVLALIALYKNDTEYALEFVRAAQMRSPGMPQLYGLEASIMMREGIWDLAEELLQKALEMAPNDPRLTESLLALLVNQKRYAEARERFLDDEEERPGAATPNVLLLAARAFAAGAEAGDGADLQTAMMLLHRASRSRVIARSEAEFAPEFAALKERPDFQREIAILRTGPASPRLFQPFSSNHTGESYL